ncbi:TadE-like protein [Herbinix hemicellulosilytica]|uniref:Putative membrane protein n=1 Tax=Herbinix hemicellulosilytica TaxID=1564487 RepID=A0A0H5SKU8_HERHM|nr:TadE family protein [Herbinix hemicellulosilytica]RBP57897.1 TadE-like protein [Herbinix hemicellulosilytica]CRZ35745.1 putative membrane protein [Herbinix hemicellulosilytica]
MSKTVNGKFTVEAALVMPVVLLAIVSVIFMSFYLYDYCRIQGITDSLLHKAALYLKHESDIENGKIFYEDIEKQGVFYQAFSIPDYKIHSMESLLSKKLSRGLIATEVTDVKVSADSFKVIAYVEGVFQLPIKGIGILPINEKTVRVKAERKIHNPANTVRIYEVILELGSKINGLNKLEDKLKTLLP